MKTFKFLLIGILVLFILTNLLAEEQKKTLTHNPPPTLRQKYKAIVNDTIRLKYTIDTLQLYSNGRINVLTKQNVDLRKDIDNLKLPIVAPTAPKEKYSPDIDKLLNIEDTSIFSKFKPFPPQSIHPRSRNFYQLIENIHSLNELLMDIEKNIKTIDGFDQSLKSAINMAQSTIMTLTQQSENLNKKAKEDLVKAGILIDKINDTDNVILQCRSESQRNFYKSLVEKKYNEFLKKIYPSN